MSGTWPGGGWVCAAHATKHRTGPETGCVSLLRSRAQDEGQQRQLLLGPSPRHADRTSQPGRHTRLPVCTHILAGSNLLFSQGRQSCCKGLTLEDSPELAVLCTDPSLNR